MPVVAYLITSYQPAPQLLRLLGALRAGSPEAVLAVHQDLRAPTLEGRALARFGAHLVLPALAVRWGDVSQVQAVLSSLSWLRERADFDWVVLLSGQDYPIRPLEQIERRLGESEVEAFLEARPCPPPEGAHIDEFALRYHFQWRRIPRRLGPAPLRGLLGRSGRVRLRLFPRGGMWLGVKARTSPFSGSFRCYHGSDWFSLSRKAVERLLLPGVEREALLRYHRRTLIPSEAYVQTVLANDPAVRLSGDVGRYTRWGVSHASSPATLGTGDLEEMLASGADFARKFDEGIDREVLAEIDRRVHGLRGRPAS